MNTEDWDVDIYNDTTRSVSRDQKVREGYLEAKVKVCVLKYRQDSKLI